MSVKNQSLPGAVVQLKGGLQAAVDRRGQATDYDALIFFAGEDEEVHVGGSGDSAVDCAVHLDALGLLDVVVRLLLGDLVQITHDEGARITDSPLADESCVVDAD